MAALGWLLNLDFAGSNAEVAIAAAPTVDEGRDSGGGEPWWTGEWITPPKEPIPGRAEVRPNVRAPRRRITAEQKAKLDESFVARAEAAALAVDMARLGGAIEQVETALAQRQSRRARQRLYDERERIRRKRRDMKEQIIALEKRAAQAAAELQGLEWLAFLQAEDEQFMRIVLELI